MKFAMALKVAIIGCGRMGERRAEAVARVSGLQLEVVCDYLLPRAQALAAPYGCEAASDWKAVVQRDAIDLVIVATPNNLHAPIAIEAMAHGKHVLCEKPLARRPDEAEAMVLAVQRHQVKLKTGFNFRFHAQTWRAFELLRAGRIGRPLFFRGALGHAGVLGGRPGFECSWFVDPEQAGGGAFLDCGSHLLDLARWAMGDFVEVSGVVATNCLPGKMRGQPVDSSGHPTEDNAGGLLKTADGRLAILHASWTQWHQSMVVEISGTEGALVIDNDARMTVLSTKDGYQESFDFSYLTWDPSRQWELEEFLSAIQEDREPLANGHDGLQAVRLAYAMYEACLTGKVMRM
jgi:predicted dehydrogenase